MFKRKSRFEVVPESAYTDFGDRQEEVKSAPSNGGLITAATAATASLATYAVTTYKNPTTISTPDPTSIPPTLSTSEPLNALTQNPPTLPVDMMTPEMIPVWSVGDKTLELLATALDPVVQVITALSFPVASVVMMGACFFFMFGNSEKAWNMIMNAGLGYVLIQMFPLFLKIMKGVGAAVQQG